MPSRDQLRAVAENVVPALRFLTGARAGLGRVAGNVQQPRAGRQGMGWLRTCNTGTPAPTTSSGVVSFELLARRDDLDRARPFLLWATSNALRSISGTAAGVRISSAHLVIGRQTETRPPIWWDSFKDAVQADMGGECRQRVLPLVASVTPSSRFGASGPSVAVHTPTSPVSRMPNAYSVSSVQGT
jgi:hypothetical protein